MELHFPLFLIKDKKVLKVQFHILNDEKAGV
jgi:hypothetical protein